MHHNKKPGLNPYCIGSSNHADKYGYNWSDLDCLNPYCIGSSNHAVAALKL